MTYQFAQPEALWGLIPLGLFLSYLLYRRASWPEGFSWRRFWLSCFAFSFGLLALARPQGGSYMSQPEPSSANVFLAVDISNSMLAEDVTPNRLKFSALFIQKLLEFLPNPKVALSPFAASGFLQLPLTSDVYAISEFLTSLDPSITSHQGTDLTAALQGLLTIINKAESEATDRFEDWHNPKVVLLSDGEAHEKFDPAVLIPFEKKGIQIFTVGVGSEEGGVVPREVLPQGPSVKTKLMPSELRVIAHKTGGAYFSGSFESLSSLAGQISSSLKWGKRKTQFKAQTELFPFLLIVSILFFLTEFFFGRWQYVIRLLILGVGLLSSSSLLAEDSQTKAIEVYNQALQESKQGNLARAAELFEESALLLNDSTSKKKALFNLGNVFLKTGDPEQALESYQKAYRLVAPSESFNLSANQKISENMALAAQALEMMKNQAPQEGQEGSGEGSKSPGEDPKGPKQFQGESLNDGQKQKLYDLIASEEKQTQKRLRERNAPPPNQKGKAW